MNQNTDPRIYFSAERTLLAWLRTGLTIIAIGFLISRFGLVLEVFTIQVPSLAHHASTLLSASLGVSFVLVGAMAIATAAFQHRRFISNLEQSNLPVAYSCKLAIMLSFFVSILGFVLAAYLWHS